MSFTDIYLLSTRLLGVIYNVSFARYELGSATKIIFNEQASVFVLNPMGAKVKYCEVW